MYLHAKNASLNDSLELNPFKKFLKIEKSTFLFQKEKKKASGRACFFKFFSRSLMQMFMEELNKLFFSLAVFVIVENFVYSKSFPV